MAKGLQDFSWRVIPLKYPPKQGSIFTPFACLILMVLSEKPNHGHLCKMVCPPLQQAAVSPSPLCFLRTAAIPLLQPSNDGREPVSPSVLLHFHSETFLKMKVRRQIRSEQNCSGSHDCMTSTDTRLERIQPLTIQC